MESEKVSHSDAASAEATRDPIFLLQERLFTYTGLPDGYEAEDGDIFKIDDPDSCLTDKELSTMTHGDYDIPYALPRWETCLVFDRREQAERYAENTAHRYPHGWRVYCVPAEGDLKEILKNAG